MALERCDLSEARADAPSAGFLQQDLRQYVCSMLLVNVALASLFACLMGVLGTPHPLPWAVAAAAISLVPVLGPAVAVGALTLVSALTAEDLAPVLLVPVATSGLLLLRYRLLEPLVAARQLALHPALVLAAAGILALLWGIRGLLLALPLLLLLRLLVLQLCSAFIMLRRQPARLPR